VSLLRFFRRFPRAPDPPIRAELFGLERLEQHAESLADAQPVARGRGRGRPILERVTDNAHALRDAYQPLADDARERRPSTPAAEWVIENFYIVDEQLREIRDDLPAGYYRELPKLSAGPFTGYPRVYGIAWAFVAHTDSRFDPEALRRFILAYQRVQPLTIGELWAVAITLRIVLVENLRRMAGEILARRSAQLRADRLADNLLGIDRVPVADIPSLLRPHERFPLIAAFAVRLIQRFRDQDPDRSPGLAWLGHRLAAQDQTADTVVQHEMQTQAATTVTVRNVITSMRLMSALDWAEFFESVSLVDDVLRSGSDFAAMDFASRDNYRHAIEELARGSRRDELQVTHAVMAHRAPSQDRGDPGARIDRRADPGFYLIGDGRREFEKAIGFRPPIGRRVLRAYIDAATPGYLATIVFVSCLVLALPLWITHVAGAAWTTLVLLGVVAWFPASDLVVAVVNRWVTSVVPPRLLPRLALREGIPPSLRTIVVIPTLLTDVHVVDDQLDQLEVHYLANPDEYIQFALLTDWSDAADASVPADAAILTAARRGVARLNARHGHAPDGSTRFLLLHRARRWNAGEGRWMGWERKRGKLRELNRLLRGATDTSFVSDGDTGFGVAPGIQYVVSLDADTRLPIGAVRRMVGTLAHPLNHPRFDPAIGRVCEGYGVLQPRVTAPLPLGESSFYQQITSGPAGIDPYAAAISDVYQDLFRAGSFTGKGIYDVDAFEAALDDRVPENALLSHDLFEGTFARAGLVSDIEFFEPAPSNYLVAAARQHRWARGDWQLLPWMFRFQMPAIDRWKMFDNLRRTLSAPMAVLTLLLSWSLVRTAPLAWTLLICIGIFLPALLPAFAGIWPHGRGISKRAHVRSVFRDFGTATAYGAVMVTMLAHQAWLMTDAIVRTLIRVYGTHRHLLEWLTAAQAEAGLRLRFDTFARRMAGAVVIGGVAAVVVTRWHPAAWPLALSFVVLWIASPAIAHGISLPHAIEPTHALSPAESRALRLIARRTWRFFATFVGSDDLHLPPDNYQETPTPVVAHRTSPTNLGLYLLATVAANDFGWIGRLDTVDRLEATLDAMDRLERLRGHFFNWYDTTDGRPLEPRYVSSVDSGNLAGALIALAVGCDEMLGSPVFDTAAFAGLADTAALVRLAADDSQAVVPATLRRQLQATIVPLLELPIGRPDTPFQWAERLADADATATRLAAVADQLAAAEPAGHHGGTMDWVVELQRQIAGQTRDVDTLAPWARRPDGHTMSGVASITTSLAPLGAMPHLCRRAVARLSVVRSQLATEANTTPSTLTELDASIAALAASEAACTTLVTRIKALAARARRMTGEMEFGFLFDPVRNLFAIGYRVADGALDPSQYDLLASEARLTSFIAIAKGDVPVRHWFHLGRALTPIGTDSVLISWSGSMFEYLMPSLLMQVPAGGLLDQTCRLVVRRQIGYATERGVPWGISESAYSVRNIEMTYQYSTFGVPGLGLRRQLGEDLVIAPYATGLAAMVDPRSAVENFRQLADAGASGAYGLYESLDYTPSRLPAGARVVVVRTYMAHHQGMLLLGIADALQHGQMRRRFHAEPMVRASELLLQERTPRDVPVARPPAEDLPPPSPDGVAAPAARRFTSAHSVVPRIHLLSNGRYAVMVTAAGSGYSRWRDLAVTRWRNDATCDRTGMYFFCRDVSSGAVWSATHQPTGVEPDEHVVVFSEDRAEYTRRDGAISTRCEVIVSAEDDAEVRRVTLHNLGLRTREVEVTSYAEVVLAPHAADVAHPAFSNLFVHTECLPDKSALLATRRPRSPEEAAVWLAHVVAVNGETGGSLEWESDRSCFIGRGRTVRDPAAMVDGARLSNSAGSVLDPVIALRRRVRLRPGARAQLVFSTMVAPTREQVLDLADKYQDASIFERVAAMAWTQAQVQLQHLSVSPDEAQLFQAMAGPLAYPDRVLRAPADLLLRGLTGRGVLWAHGISGDLPIVLVQIDDLDAIGLVRQLLRAHEYWRMKCLAVDLVILNERGTSYIQDLQHALDALVRAAQGSEADRRLGSVFVLRADLLQGGDHDALVASAWALLSGSRGALAEQLVRVLRPPVVPPVTRPRAEVPLTATAPDVGDLERFNGLGGFAASGQEYVTVLGGGQSTPAPWINVIANPEFGCLVSESGATSTWSVNSQENLLTPWSNDPVSDPTGEAFYIRDEETGYCWSPCARPIREPGTVYRARHGAGYTRLEYSSHGIESVLVHFVPPEDSIKVSRLTLTNRSSRPRRVSVTAYVEWVLGVSRDASAPFIVTEVDAQTSAILARNMWNADFRDRIAFADLGGRQTHWTADRAEFLGRNGSVEQPSALHRATSLSRRAGAGLDPCAALQTTFVLQPGASTTVDFFLGETASRDDAIALITRYRGLDLDQVLAEVTAQWDRLLNTVQVTTPDRSVDLMLNRWLLYQTLACRVWARTAFYQASGAYGFRDQLQDVMALVPASAPLAREQILRAAGRQFVEGDVQHWWHPTTGRGIRTRISDDLLWLPYVVTHYVETCGDSAVLDVKVPFLEGARLGPNELECFFQPRTSPDAVTVYEHCARTIDRSLAVGAHGLPLIGTGDWNDGMNRVGPEGRGESVWLGWFLATVLQAWAPLAASRGEVDRATAWREHVAALTTALDHGGWDGEWYRRAYFDDGTPLGSATNDECRIDAISQSWSVISGIGNASKIASAMSALDQELVHRDERLHLLLTPPFDHTALEPGYIKGYLPGVRENGGQYTHAAIWSIVAWTMLGDGDRAATIFSLLNPINHSANAAAVTRYKVEPYVVAGDVYSQAPHVGRGGWTWYSGSAGWLYRAGLEYMLGFRLRAARLVIDPCIPADWPGFAIRFRRDATQYDIRVDNPDHVTRGVVHVDVDGTGTDFADGIPLLDDGVVHRVRVVLGVRQ
jgi:cyclic beta-1,2-glucan synthetase